MASPSTSPAAPSPLRSGLQAVPPPESTRRWPLIVLAVVLVVGVAAWQFRARTAAKSAASEAAAVKTVKAVRGVLQQTVRVSGSVAARNFTNVFAPLVQ